MTYATFSRLLLCTLLSVFNLFPSLAVAFDVDRNNAARLGSFTERLARQGQDPNSLDGLVYVFCAPGSVGPTKIGVSNDGNVTRRNNFWLRKETSSPQFELNTRQVVRNLTRAETYAVERNTHAYLKSRGLWLDPKMHLHNSTEVFDVSCAEALSVVKTQAAIIRAMRSDGEKERARTYAAATRTDDATDFRRNPCRRNVDLPGNSRVVRRFERTVSMGSTLYCKATN